jgi:predicted nucleotidyltransferase
MTNVDKAFSQFRHNLESPGDEEKSARRHESRLRGQLSKSFDIKDAFLFGSYERHTKTKPLGDVDMMIVLEDASYLDKPPHVILKKVQKALLSRHGTDQVCIDRRAVCVKLGVPHAEDLAGRVISFDIVPALEKDGCYLIPDAYLKCWINTNPKEHTRLATAKNEEFEDQWKSLVKMFKMWNRQQGSPVYPSFLIEVIALKVVRGNWTGSYPREIRDFFASAASRIAEGWPDPAGVGPDISDVLDRDPEKMHRAKAALQEAERACTDAMKLDDQSATGEALRVWRSLFGDLFPLS